MHYGGQESEEIRPMTKVDLGQTVFLQSEIWHC